jgi:TonB dependent receptor-like, beta-barrel/TonB-dependent Receptor Plug Domain
MSGPVSTLLRRYVSNARFPKRLWMASAIGLMLPGSVLAQTDTQPATTLASSPADREVIVVEGARILSPGLSSTGANDYLITSKNINDMPAGINTVLTDVVAQMPGVGIDQNQQVHIRDTEGSGFQYQINGVQVPFDINTNPPFISMINPLFIDRLDLVDGILPARFSYADGGVLDIKTKDGCEQPGGSATMYAGQRGMVQPSIQYAGCSADGRISYYGSALYSQNNLAFSSATPGANAYHDATNQGQAFGLVSYAINDTSKLTLMFSVSDSNNQLPNDPTLPALFTLAHAPNISAADINSYLNFRDYLGMVSYANAPTDQLSYQLSYAVHSINEMYDPDNAGELIYQGVATTASHKDFDNTLQGDLTYKLEQHTITSGFYLGAYDVTANSSSLVFPADAAGNQTGSVPVTVVNHAHALNILSGIYINDLWQISPEWRLNIGVRRDELTGFTHGNQVDPTLNLSWMSSSDTTFHAGVARYFQVPSFEGISPKSPAAFANTTGAGPAGSTTPLTEDDWEWDLGVVQKLLPGLTVSLDGFYEYTRHYLDAGQFGVVPIFAPFNYHHGNVWGGEAAFDYKVGDFSAYANVTLAKNYQTGVATGQFNFTEPGEVAYIDSHYIVLDHQPFIGIATGATYNWNSFKFSVQANYTSGLDTGFANTVPLPSTFHMNVGIERTFEIGGYRFSNRVTMLNILDRTNLIRPAGGLGVFESAYGPRFTVYDALTVSF